MNDIDKIVRTLCVLKGISVAELSVKLGGSKQNLFNKLYRNDIKLSDLDRIADTLGLELHLQFVDKETKAVIYPPQ